MNSPCEDCVDSTPMECVKLSHQPCGKNVEYCEHCHLFWIWGLISHEDIKTVREGRGEFWGAPCSEEVVVGFTCPGCGEYNEF